MGFQIHQVSSSIEKKIRIPLEPAAGRLLLLFNFCSCWPDMAISLWGYWKSVITLETLHIIPSFPIWNPKISSKFCSLGLLHVTVTKYLPPFLCHTRIIDQHLSTLLGYWRRYDWKRIGTSSWVPFALLGKRAFAMVTNDVPLVVRVSLHIFRNSRVRPKGRSAEQRDQNSARVAVTLSILPSRVF